MINLGAVVAFLVIFVPFTSVPNSLTFFRSVCKTPKRHAMRDHPHRSSAWAGLGVMTDEELTASRHVVVDADQLL